MKVNCVYKPNLIEAYYNEDLVGFIRLGASEHGLYVQYTEVISEANRKYGIGTQMYLFLLNYCKDNSIKVFHMKNPTPSASRVLAKLQGYGVKYIERLDLMSTNHELEFDLTNFHSN